MLGEEIVIEVPVPVPMRRSASADPRVLPLSKALPVEYISNTSKSMTDRR
jgi:hypothetical protein